jgi:hypothetical protein
MTRTEAKNLAEIVLATAPATLTAHRQEIGHRQPAITANRLNV